MERERIREVYDAVADRYADAYGDDLRDKPFDRAQLDRLAALAAGLGPICDAGCGPGQVAAYLHEAGADVFGADLSEGMVRAARRRYPGVRFEQQDLLAATFPPASLGAVAAWYAIVHFAPNDLATVFSGFCGALVPGGFALVAFHVGHETRRVEGFLGGPAALDFAFFQPNDIVARLEAAGFVVQEALVREPYEGVEYPSRRAYVLARRPS